MFWNMGSVVILHLAMLMWSVWDTSLNYRHWETLISWHDLLYGLRSHWPVEEGSKRPGKETKASLFHARRTVKLICVVPNQGKVTGTCFTVIGLKSFIVT